MGLVQERPQVTFLNVNLGKLRNKKKGIEAPGYEGIITGIRLVKKKDPEGREREELQVRMADPTDVANPNVIISGLFETVNGVTVWARMLIARLLKATREGIIGQGSLLQLGVYTPKQDSKATCVSLRVPDDASPIRGIELPTHDLLLTRGIIRDGIVELAAIYGDLSKNPPVEYSSNDTHDTSGDDGHEEEYEEEYEPIPGDSRVPASQAVTNQAVANQATNNRTTSTGNTSQHRVSTPAPTGSATAAASTVSHTDSEQRKAEDPSIEFLYAEFERCAKKAFGDSWEVAADDMVMEMFHNTVLFAANMTREQLLHALTKLRADLKLPSLSDAEMLWKTAHQRKWTRPAFNALLSHYELNSEYEVPEIAFKQFLADVRSVENMQEFLKATAHVA